MHEEIKAWRDRNKGERKQTGHKTFRPARNGTCTVKKEKSNEGHGPKKIVRPDRLKIEGQILKRVAQCMPAGVNDRPLPELVEDAGVPKDETGQSIRHNGSDRKSGQSPQLGQQ